MAVKLNRTAYEHAQSLISDIGLAAAHLHGMLDEEKE
jgi:hypothetical protein